MNNVQGASEYCLVLIVFSSCNLKSGNLACVMMSALHLKCHSTLREHGISSELQPIDSWVLCTMLHCNLCKALDLLSCCCATGKMQKGNGSESFL